MGSQKSKGLKMIESGWDRSLNNFAIFRSGFHLKAQPPEA
jgi:hypothetical protein